MTDQLKNPVVPEILVDVTSTIETKKTMLACHRSQKEWLDSSQGMDSYLIDMMNICEAFGKKTDDFKYAEGWILHNHMGFCGKNDDPLSDALGNAVYKNS